MLPAITVDVQRTCFGTPPAFLVTATVFKTIAKMSGRHTAKLKAVSPPSQGGYMKKQLSALLGLGLLLLAASAYAQTVNMKIEIPFNFTANGAKLPAGQYTITGLGIAGEALAIRNADQKAETLVMGHRCESLTTSQQSKLVFHRYGDRYFLAQVWTAGNDAGRELPKSRQEVEVAQDYTSQNVVLVASLR
jgi:hypothetical protein